MDSSKNKLNKKKLFFSANTKHNLNLHSCLFLFFFYISYLKVIYLLESTKLLFFLYLKFILKLTYKIISRLLIL